MMKIFLLLHVPHIFYLCMNSHSTEAERWELYERGPRLYVFPTDLESALSSLASTLLLFEPTLTQGIE